MEIYENVEKNNKTLKQNESLKLIGRKIIHASKPFQRAFINS